MACEIWSAIQAAPRSSSFAASSGVNSIPLSSTIRLLTRAVSRTRTTLACKSVTQGLARFKRGMMIHSAFVEAARPTATSG